MRCGRDATPCKLADVCAGTSSRGVATHAATSAASCTAMISVRRNAPSSSSVDTSARSSVDRNARSFVAIAAAGNARMAFVARRSASSIASNATNLASGAAHITLAISSVMRFVIDLDATRNAQRLWIVVICAEVFVVSRAPSASNAM